MALLQTPWRERGLQTSPFIIILIIDHVIWTLNEFQDHMLISRQGFQGDSELHNLPHTIERIAEDPSFWTTLPFSASWVTDERRSSWDWEYTEESVIPVHVHCQSSKGRNHNFGKFVYILSSFYFSEQNNSSVLHNRTSSLHGLYLQHVRSVIKLLIIWSSVNENNMFISHP